MQSPSEIRPGGSSNSNPKSSRFRPQDAPSRLRISHACDRCRAMRVRCSGGPRCEKCINDDATCAYSDGKREHNKQVAAKADRIENLKHDRALLVDALKDLSNTIDLKPDQRGYVASLLQKVSDDVPVEGAQSKLSSQVLSDSSPKSTGYEGSIGSIFGAEHNAASGIGSPGLNGKIHQDLQLDGGSGMVGFVGKMSETSWIRRILGYLEDTPSSLDMMQTVLEDASPAPGMTAALTYFIDEDDLLSINEDHINHYQKPSPETSLLLTEAFFHSLQGGFPLVSYQSFQKSHEDVMSEDYPTTWADLRHLALCNIVWASGARWLQKSELMRATLAEDHLVYYARARALGCDHRVQSEHPDVQMLQSIGVMAFYLLLNGSLQRAWNVLGQAIRHAISLGLHLNLNPDAASSEDYETRKNLWYSLYRIETLLAEILGRPTCIQHIVTELSPYRPNQDLSALPQDTQTTKTHDSSATWMQFLEQHQYKPSFATSPMLSSRFPTAIRLGIPPSYFPAALALSHVSTDIATKLFSNQPQKTWYQMQCSIQDIDGTVQAWCNALAPELHIDNINRTAFDPRPNLELALNLCSLQMLLYRPCLCKIEIKHESSGSQEFNLVRATFCVRAALKKMNLMPNGPVAAQIFQTLPCWSTLHYLCQAGAVLLLEMCLNMQHMPTPTEAEQVTAAFKKVLEYLWVMSPHMKSAYKAYQIFSILGENVSRRFLGVYLLQGVVEPAIPPHWNLGDNVDTEALLKALRQLDPG